MEKIVVNDTNIFIDLIDIGLLDYFIKLPWEFYTTKMVLSELKKKEQHVSIEELVKTFKIKVSEMNGNEVMEIVKLYHKNRETTNVSMTDCSVWFYAKSNHYTLLTGDMKLRKSATKDGVDVHGLLYVFGKMVEHNVLTKHEAAEKLNILKKQNNRLPMSEIEKRIKDWTKNK